MADLLLDPTGGISGDMFLGALIGCGAPIQKINSTLKKLKLKENFRIRSVETKQGAFAGQLVEVEVKRKNRWVRADQEEHSNKKKKKAQSSDHHHHHHHDHSHTHSHSHSHHDHSHGRTWKEIDTLIQKSDLTERIKSRSRKVFKVLAEAEAQVHGQKPEKVHFHEVGALDSILDIVGSCIALELLDVNRIYSSTVSVASGHVHCAHGVLPLPAPATQLLLKGRPVLKTLEKTELCTPTGAAFLNALAEFSLPEGGLTITEVGFGLSHRQPQHVPPFLRASLIQKKGDSGYIEEELVWISCNIDDMQPEILAEVCDKMMNESALDVSQVPLMMKKGRAGVELRVLCEEKYSEALGDIILNHTTSFGYRIEKVHRRSLSRQEKKVRLHKKVIRVKVATQPNGETKFHIEFSDLKALSEVTGKSLLQCQKEIIQKCL